MSCHGIINHTACAMPINTIFPGYIIRGGFVHLRPARPSVRPASILYHSYPITLQGYTTTVLSAFGSEYSVHRADQHLRPRLDQATWIRSIFQIFDAHVSAFFVGPLASGCFMLYTVYTVTYMCVCMCGCVCLFLSVLKCGSISVWIFTLV